MVAPHPAHGARAFDRFSLRRRLAAREKSLPTSSGTFMMPHSTLAHVLRSCRRSRRSRRRGLAWHYPRCEQTRRTLMVAAAFRCERLQ